MKVNAFGDENMHASPLFPEVNLKMCGAVALNQALGKNLNVIFR